MGSSSDSGGGFSSQSTPTPQQLAAAQQASQLQQAGGLQYQGVGLPLIYVPPTPAFQAASQANSAQMNAAAQQAQQPSPQPQQQVQSNNGQGFVNGPTSAAGTNPYSTLTPQQQALYALQAQSGQTPGGLMVGPNHTLVQAPAPPASNINVDPNGAQPTQTSQDQQNWNLPTSNGPM